MKKRISIIIIICFGAFQVLWAQSRLVTDLTNAVGDLVGSFLNNPYNHSNTQKVYDYTVKLKGVLDDLYRQVPIEAQQDYNSIVKLKRLQRCLEHITAGILGRSPASVSASDMEDFNSLFYSFGWKREIIKYTDDIVLYEYSKDAFKMVLAKNTLPKKEYGDYNPVAYQCYEWSPIQKKHSAFMGRVLFGGNYQFVLCGDNVVKYKKITKVSSKRGTNF